MLDLNILVYVCQYRENRNCKVSEMYAQANGGMAKAHFIEYEGKQNSVRGGCRVAQKIKMAPMPFHVNGAARMIEGEKVPINFNNKQPLALDLRLSSVNRRVAENSLSIYNSKGSYVDRLCPWKLSGPLSFDFNPNLVIKACQVCSSSSSEFLLKNERKYGTGLCNVIKLPYEFRIRQHCGANIFLPRSLKYIIFALTAKKFEFESLVSGIFTNENVLTYAATKLYGSLPSESDDLEQESTSKTEKSSQYSLKSLRRIFEDLMAQFREIRANMNGAVLCFFGFFLMKFICRIYDKVIIAHVHIQQMKEAASSEKLTTVYLPLHKSHMDYMLISLILWQYGLKWPHIIAGNNLRLPIISWVLSRMGAVFIQRGSKFSLSRVSLNTRRKYIRNLNPFRRRCVSADETELSASGKGLGQECYLTMLKAYTEEMLSAGWPLEVYLEGGRSRTGKPIAEAKVGILRSIVDGIENEKFKVNIVPVSISYDRVMDMNGFVTEMQGLPKKAESFWGAFKSVIMQLRQRYGCVRVHFGQPFSAREMVDHFKICEMQQLSKEDSTLKESPIHDGNRDNLASPSLRAIPSVNSQLSIADFRFFGTTNLFSSDNINRSASKKVVQSVGQHCLYLAQKCAAVMSTHLVAFVLLNVHRRGATISQLLSSIEALIEKMLKTDLFGSTVLGFTAEANEVLNHFLSLFPECVNVVSKLKPSELVDKQCSSTERVIYPKLTLPHVFSLMYLSNNLAFHFVRQSVVATVIMSLAGLYADTTVPCVSNKLISIRALLDNCAVLCTLLEHEFVICAPCENIESVMEQTLALFENSELVFREKSSDMLISAAERDRQDRIAAQFDFEDESDSEFSQYSNSDDGELLFVGGTDTSTVKTNNNSISKEDRLYVNVETKEQRNELIMFSSILCPVINCYWLVSLNLKNLLSRDIEYSIFVKQTHASIKAKYDVELINYPESCCYEYVKSAIGFFVSLSILRTYIAVDASTKLSLTDFYKDIDNLKELQNMFFQYKL